MKQELIYNILPIKAYEIELKCFYASHFILGRIFALWNKKKKAIKVSKDYFLKIKHLKKPAFWLILKELQDKNIITVTRINNNNNVMIINFTDDFIKNYVNAPASNNVEDCEDCEEITEITDVTESIEEDEHTTEPLEDNENTEYTPAQLQMIEENKKYGLVGDDYLPVEGWAHTDRQDYRELLKEYGGKVPEIPEEVLNFDFGQFCDDDFKIYIIDKDKVIYCKPDDEFGIPKEPVFTDDNNNGLSVNYYLGLRTKGELSLFTYLDIYKYLTSEYNHLKNNGKI